MAQCRWLVKEVLPPRKQLMALSATYSETLLQELEALMTDPRHVMLCGDTVSLLGVKQFFQELPGDFCTTLPAPASDGQQTYEQTCMRPQRSPQHVQGRGIGHTCGVRTEICGPPLCTCLVQQSWARRIC